MEITYSGSAWTIDVKVVAPQLESVIATGTPPLIVASTTLVPNLNASLLGGKEVGTSANNIVALNGSAQLPAVDGSLLTNLPGGSAGLTTVTSAASIALDFDDPVQKLAIGHNVTFTTTNRTAGETILLAIFGHASNSYSLTFSADWKNVSGVALPTQIAANAVYQFRLSCFGSAETDVTVEYVSGAGVDYAFTASAAIYIHKSSSANFNPVSGTMTGGPSRGWVLKTINASVGTFTGSFGSYIVSQTVDVDTGRLTAVQWLALSSSSQQADLAVVWYPTEIAAVGQVCSGYLGWSIQDGVESAGDNLLIVAYGADEVQQLQWTNTGTPTGATGGRFTLYHSSYGSTAAIDVAGGTSAIQSALSTLMGSAAPTVGGDMTTTTFTFSNGALAHTDTAELSLGGGSPSVHDSTGNGSFSMTQTQTGDSSTISDVHSGSWGPSDAGTVTFGGTVYIRGGSTTVVIGAVTYTVADYGSSFTLTCNDLDPHGGVSATPDLGFALTGTMSTTTAGNS